MYFFTFLLKNLFRRKARSILTIIGVAVAVCTLVTLQGVSDSFSDSFQENFVRKGVDLVITSKGVLIYNSELEQRFADAIHQVPGVKTVSYSLNQTMEIKRRGGSSIPVQVIGWPLDSPDFAQLEVVSGRALQTDDRRGIMLGVKLAEVLDKTPGEDVEMVGETFQVVGVFDSPTIFEKGAAVVRLEDLQEVMFQEGKVTGFGVTIEPSADPEAALETVAARIEQLTDEQGRSLRLAAEPAEKYVQGFLPIRIIDAMSKVTSLIALIIGAVSMLNTMIMSVLERVREIGILRAIGWRRSRIIRMVLGESLLLSSMGAIIGVSIAFAVTYLLAHWPMTSGYVSGAIAPRVLFQGFVVAWLVGLIGGIYPAYRAANLLPTEALRHE